MKTRSVAQNSAFALAGDLASKGGTVVLMMVAGRALSTAEFAVLATALAAATVLTAVLDLGSQTLLTRDGVAGPGARGELLRALARARVPLIGAAAVAAVVVGALTGREPEALATVLIAAAGTAQLSLTGALRSAQDLRPEALAKLLAGVLTAAAAVACVVLGPRAATVLLAVAAATAIGCVPMAFAARRIVAAGAPQPTWTALRRAAPLGVMALATLAYYRSGTIGLSLLSSSTQTADFAAASTIAWGLLCMANAVTTGLLPRLSDARDATETAMITRRALVWVSTGAVAVSGLVALLARPLLTVLFGPRFAGAAPALVVLAAATAVIAPAGVLGTALVALRRLRPLGLQVGVSLAINLAVIVLLVPSVGAIGAATATLACEFAALVLLAVATVRALPELIVQTPRASPLPSAITARVGR
jgi:O-antigen/teichoic acid export membrane protein